jgi:hypothetical protein
VAQGVTADAEGVVVVGTTSGSLDETQGAKDAFVARYSPLGDQLWVKQLGSPANDDAFAVAADGLGNVYVVGATSGSLFGDNQGSQDLFVAKYSSSGERLWIRQKGTDAGDLARAVAIAPNGEVIVAGYTQGALDEVLNNGGQDIFVARYSVDGDVQWLHQWGTTEADRAFGVAVDAGGNIFVGGNTDGLFDPEAPESHFGEGDAYLAKISGAGELLFVRQVGSDENEVGNCVGVNDHGNAFLAGSTRGDVDGTSAGFTDALVVGFR